jgi:diguanylate cyclase (GGDEF)-like protein
MNETLSWVMFLFYISAGYLLVVGAASATIASVSRSVQNRFAFGALAVMGFAGAGYQLATAFYYQTPSETAAIDALVWQTDCASLAVLAVGLYCAAQRYKRVMPDNLVFAFVLGALMLIVANRTSAFSLHFVDVASLQKQPLVWDAGLSYLQGKPGGGALVWFGVALLSLGSALAWNVHSWRHLEFRRRLLRGLFLALLVVAAFAGLAIDIGWWSGFYPLGFALTGLVLWISINSALDAARNGRDLKMRERQMEGEILQRRKAEDKLERLSQVFMQAPSAAHIVDIGGRTLQVNEESVRLLRRDVSATPKVNFLNVLEQYGVNKRQLLDDLAAGSMQELGPYLFTAGVPVDALYTVRDSWLSFKLYPIFSQQHQLQELVVSLEDVTERQFVENAIKTISVAVSTETGHAFFNQLAKHLARLLNKKYVYIGLKKVVEQRLTIETLAVAVDGELVGNFQFEVTNSPSEKALQLGTYTVPRQLQREFAGNSILRDLAAQSFVGAAIVDAEKNAIGLIAVLDDKPMDYVKQLQEVVQIFVSRAGAELHRLEAEAKIRKMAYEDHLTGLPNRSALNEHVQGLLQGKDVVERGAFIQLDLDHFKTINDALGHDIGDDVLRSIGRRLRQNLDESVWVARIGGDEFAVVLGNLGAGPDTSLERTTQRIITLMEQPVQVGDHLLDLGCTIGVVLFPEFASTALDVFRNADIALNRAKSSGRGSYQLFTPEMRDSVSQRLRLESGLRAALQNEELSLFYQPQLDAAGNLMGAEALIRWHHPEQGWIPPLTFIPVAEETGLINQVGQWVLEAALQDCKRWSEQHIPFAGHVSVNVSPWQFARPDFVTNTLKAIDRLQVPPSNITLEVTESALLTDISDTIAKLSQLRRAGLTIALDDFGTGYSSLAYLRDLPLDILKIDKAFVDALETSAHEPLVESMIAIGHNMGLQVVAEGVESQIQLERLKALGCKVFQGYLFSRPMAEPDFVRWLQEHNDRASSLSHSAASRA